MIVFVFNCIITCLFMFHSQGVKQTDHFGFICRDAVESGPNQYMCYVFQCASESLVSSSIPPSFLPQQRAHMPLIHYLSGRKKTMTAPCPWCGHNLWHTSGRRLKPEWQWIWFWSVLLLEGIMCLYPYQNKPSSHHRAQIENWVFSNAAFVCGPRRNTYPIWGHATWWE